MTKKTDLLLTNAIILSMDENFNIYEPGAIAIKGDAILEVGDEDEILKTYTAKNTIDCDGKILMPGLINAHTHVPMTLLRGLADDLRLDVWLLGYIMPVEREFVNPEFVRLGTSIGCAELIRSGVTAFADMYYFEEEVAKTTAEIGLRALCGQTILKFPAPDAKSYEDSLAAARTFIEAWKDHPLIVPAVSPHAPYTCTDEILQASAALAVEFDVPLHIHLSESEVEVKNMREEKGMPVIPYVKKQNLFDAKVLAAHCVHVDMGEIHTLHHHGAGVAHNPSSNLKLASGAAPVVEMLEVGLNVGIGTDGPASNNDLDMFEDMRFAAFLAKYKTNNPTSLPAKTALAMATRIGARALHIGDITGSLETGKRADLILVDTKTLHNTPRFNRDPEGLYAQIVYATKSTDVSDVMVNGNWLMQDRKLLTINENELIEQTKEYTRKVDEFLIEREQSVFAKLIAIGGASEAESFEVQVKVRIDDPEPIIKALHNSNIEILYDRHYREYDAYFMFNDPSQGVVRYREDEFMDKNNEVDHVRYRLTLIGESRENEYPSDVILSRSRYLAPATQSRRFYREYFKPDHESIIEKDRLRWLVKYKDIEFYINIDRVGQPDLGYFLEIKSRTWSSKDAQKKAEMFTELIQLLGASPKDSVSKDYIEYVEAEK